MSQQVNLYNPALLDQGEWLTAARFVRIQLGFAVVLMAACLALAYHLHSDRQQLQAMQGRLAQAQQHLARQAAALQAKKQDTALQQQRRQVQQLADQHQQVLARLQSGLRLPPPHYSAYLLALARQSFDGLWLTGIDIAPTGGIDISGRAQQPEFLPHYIARLKREPVMQGKTFATLEMGRLKPARATAGEAAPEAPGGPAITFSLHSQDVGKKP
jgi:Tfp pilus assembly protein PilN